MHTSTSVLLKRLVRSYLRPHLGKLVLALALMILSALCTALLAKLMEPIIDRVFQARDREALWWVAGTVMAAFTLRGLSGYGHSVIMNSIGQKIVATIQLQIFSHLLRSDMAFFHGNPSGNLVSRMTNDAGIMRYSVAESLTSLGYSTFSLLFLTAVMFYQDWALASAAFVVFPLTAFYIAKRSGRNRRLSRRSQEE
ncbi:MAG: ABC transporter transmembrane domain-containing protein, partial [Pseudomonadota bacterium]|nr:ABC transporter transmembrane domain-containing protein [Pseudomonadota bacterium]